MLQSCWGLFSAATFNWLFVRRRFFRHRNLNKMSSESRTFPHKSAGRHWTQSVAFYVVSKFVSMQTCPSKSLGLPKRCCTLMALSPLGTSGCQHSTNLQCAERELHSIHSFYENVSPHEQKAAVITWFRRFECCPWALSSTISSHSVRTITCFDCAVPWWVQQRTLVYIRNKNWNFNLYFWWGTAERLGSESKNK